jgi:general secretion pathway protein H
LRGFTLLELLIVFVVLALVGAVVTPGLAGRLGPVEAETTAREIAARLRQTRSEAIGSNLDLAFAVDVEQRSYSVAGRPPRPLPANLDVSLVTAEIERLGRNAGAIRFFPDGSSTGGEIRLTGGNSSFRIEVDWLTGRVRIEKGGPVAG